ncbi:MAG: helix-hairpin-helix domain-containing protein [Candidatus Marsarchaeota archaeon]|jgi:ERCC4-type nuclease|nr:helix-hairpin-helix domain-containing protein [Candidatus Marsarchaeota archaeon]MCL5111322.1 helix-hairpin-helix domain-containing protein [Candidatus Marsarchaeota archaeon]
MKQSFRVIVDRRERNQELRDALEENGIEIDEQMVHVGDYVISDRVCIERKTVSDFESSLMNGRLLDQAKRLKENYQLPIIIVEGDQEEYRLGRNIIIGAMVALYVDNGIEVIMSRGAKDTSDIITTIAKHEQDGSAREPSMKGGRRAYSTSNYQEYIVANLPGIGPKLARSLLGHFKSIRRLANADVKSLMKVEKIGKKKAEAIHATINKTYEEE